MITVKVEGMAALRAHMSNMQKQIRFAAAVALTNTAKAVKAALPAVMNRELDRPTPFTTRGIFVTPAKKDTLTAVVGFMDRQAGYLKYQIAGGTRQPGPRGIKLPGNITLNSYGNIPKGVIAKLKKAAQDGTLTGAHRLGTYGDRRKKAAPINLFLGKPTGRGWEKAPMGIWRRIPASKAGGKGKLIPVIVFEDTAAKYRPRFYLQRAGETVVRREWDKQFAVAFANAMRTAR